MKADYDYEDEDDDAEVEVKVKFCKEPGCLNWPDTTPDKTEQAKVWRCNGELHCYFPSIPAPHGLCAYHWRVRHYKEFFEKVMEIRAEVNKNYWDSKRHLIKLGGISGNSFEQESKVYL